MTRLTRSISSQIGPRRTLPSEVFDQIVERILSAHDFRCDVVHAALTSAPRFSALRIVTGRLLRITLRMPEDLARLVQDAADADHGSMSDWIVLQLEAIFAKRAQRKADK